MNTHTTLPSSLLRNLLIVALLVHASISFGETINPLVDDFNDPQLNTLGIARMHLDDTAAGGSTTTDYNVAGGVLSAKGEIAPPRGQPGWASSILLLNPQGQPTDVSTFKGVRLLIRITQGNISLSANSTDVTNYDYHAAPVVTKNDGKFHEIKISFSSMKRAWSEQTPLNTKTISGLSITAFGLQKGTFEFELKEVTFY